jgi:hypothetical protein
VTDFWHPTRSARPHDLPHLYQLQTPSSCKPTLPRSARPSWGQLIMVDALNLWLQPPGQGVPRGCEPISARLIADMCKVAGANRIMTVGLHTLADRGFVDGPVDQLFALPVLTNHVKNAYAVREQAVVSHTHFHLDDSRASLSPGTTLLIKTKGTTFGATLGSRDARIICVRGTAVIRSHCLGSRCGLTANAVQQVFQAPAGAGSSGPAGHLWLRWAPPQGGSMANRHHRTRPRKRSQQARSPRRWSERIGLLVWVLLEVVRWILRDLGS